MRLASFNILNGRALSDGEVDADRYREAVRTLDADVLGLQEVDRDQPRSHGLDLTAEAAAAMGGEGMFAPAIIGTPGESWRPAKEPDNHLPGPAYGIGLVSRLPVRKWLVVRLPSAPVRSPILIPGPQRRVLWLRDEPRVLVAAVLETPAGPLTVANTHLSFVPGWNVRQLRRAVRALKALPGPRVLLGDLNLPPAVARVASGWRVAAKLPTYPSMAPKIQLDHILIDPSAPISTRQADNPPTGISDHRPLVVEVVTG